MTIETRQLGFSYRPSAKVLTDVDLRIDPGVSVFVGPNAAGKSTLLKCLAGLLKPASGAVLVDGRELNRLPRADRTRLISFMPQDIFARASLTVFETVLLGRLDRLVWRVDPDNLKVVERILCELGISDLAGRPIDELSGGQMQMAAIAQALAREPAILIMDELISNLDLHHEFQVLGMIRKLTADRNMTTIMAMHDLNMAGRFADTIYVLNNGSLAASGRPESVLTEDLIASVYKVAARVAIDGQHGPLITPLDAI